MPVIQSKKIKHIACTAHSASSVRRKPLADTPINLFCARGTTLSAAPDRRQIGGYRTEVLSRPSQPVTMVAVTAKPGGFPANLGNPVRHLPVTPLGSLSGPARGVYPQPPGGHQMDSPARRRGPPPR